VSFGDRNALGAALGSRPISALAVTQASLAEQIIAELKKDSEVVASTGLEG
jgi:hypothetical protein